MLCGCFDRSSDGDVFLLRLTIHCDDLTTNAAYDFLMLLLAGLVRLTID